MDPIEDPQPPKAGFFRRHRILTAVLALVIVVPGVLGGYAWWLNSSLSNVDRVDITLNEADRPERGSAKAMNILLLGADAGRERNTASSSILTDAASGDWPAGKYRSDALMIAHLPADRKSATIISIPRDSVVQLYDETGKPAERSKINAALSLYGPSGAIATVENLTNLRIDHLTMLDWDGFRDITDALGGVAMTTDEGRRRFDGQEALDYVRDRFTVEGGDFGRIQRQQNFLRAIVEQSTSRGILTDPLKLQNTVDALSQSVAVDSGWSNGGIRSLAVSMRGLRSNALRFITVPTTGTADDPNLGSVVLLDQEASRVLYEAVRADRLDDFIASRPDLSLGPADRVD